VARLHQAHQTPCSHRSIHRREVLVRCAQRADWPAWQLVENAVPTAPAAMADQAVDRAMRDKLITATGLHS
jgi:hypothetical protein